MFFLFFLFADEGGGRTEGCRAAKLEMKPAEAAGAAQAALQGGELLPAFFPRGGASVIEEAEGHKRQGGSASEKLQGG